MYQTEHCYDFLREVATFLEKKKPRSPPPEKRKKEARIY